jgi:hypothetical protein
MVLPDTDPNGNLVRIFRYVRERNSWDDLTSRVFPNRPDFPAAGQRMGFAFRPLLRADGTPLEEFSGEFFFLYLFDRVGSLWISNVVNRANPPHASLLFDRGTRAGTLGSNETRFSPGFGFDLFADEHLTLIVRDAQHETCSRKIRPKLKAARQVWFLNWA